jgi:hypothetical protein
MTVAVALIQRTVYRLLHCSHKHTSKKDVDTPRVFLWLQIPIKNKNKNSPRWRWVSTVMSAPHGEDENLFREFICIATAAGSSKWDDEYKK